jgi:hypothetical protein
MASVFLLRFNPPADNVSLVRHTPDDRLVGPEIGGQPQEVGEETSRRGNLAIGNAADVCFGSKAEVGQVV